MSWLRKIKIPQVLYVPSWFHVDSWLPDDRDKRDLKYSDHTEKFVQVEAGEIVSLRQFCSPVETQKHHGSCVGNAIINALELKRIQAGLPHIDFSRMFVYYNSRLAHNATNKDKGTRIRYGMASINSIGVCRSIVWPYVSENVNKRPAWKAYREAYKTKISGYYRIDGDYTEIVEQIEHAIRSGHPVVFGCKVYADFCDGKLQPGNIARIPSRGENYRGRHAMLIVGYDAKRRLFEVKNSWGNWWAENGFCWIPYAYLRRSSADDFWVMTTEF